MESQAQRLPVRPARLLGIPMHADSVRISKTRKPPDIRPSRARDVVVPGS